MDYTVVYTWVRDCYDGEVYCKATIPRLPCCVAWGKDVQAAREQIEIVKNSWLKIAWERKWEIAEP